jgi:small subunit ribosomal protein S1
MTDPTTPQSVAEDAERTSVPSAEIAAPATPPVESPVTDGAVPAEGSAELPPSELELATPSEPLLAVEPVLDAPTEVLPAEVTAAEVTAEPTTPVESHDDNGVLAYQNGDIVPGTVTAVRPDGLDLDLDAGRTAVVPVAELVAGTSPAVGDSVEGTVIRRQGTGRYVVSPKRAARSRAWIRIVAAQESGDVQSGVVTETVKGGVIVDLGMRAFLPESLIDVRRAGKPADLIGQTVQVIVIEATKNSDRPGERIVVSRKPLMEKVRAEERATLIQTISPGDRRRGRVSALVPFGAFVDLGGVEGLVHVSELAHRQVGTPDEVVKVGDEIDVVVLEVNPERKKISLSRKRALPDPWAAFQQAHQVGDLVFGSITGLAAFGAFVKLEGEELEGLVHISELSKFRVEDPSEVVAVGEGVWVKILEITPDKRRLSLSLRRALD